MKKIVGDQPNLLTEMEKEKEKEKTENSESEKASA